MIRDTLYPIFKDYNIKQAILFGSYAKGTARENSDIDIYVESGLKGLRFYGLLEDVTTSLGRPIDLIDASQIHKGSEIMDEIKRTGVVLYG